MSPETYLAVREEPRASLSLSNSQLEGISRTDFVPQGLRGNLPAIMACVATGRALGIDDMSALRLIHIVNGRPTFSAELMVQLVRRKGHSITGQLDEGSCTVVGTRADNGDSMKVTWTLAMAQRAGLANKATWKAYPEALLWARAVSQLCRMLFADCFAGATYTEEELSDTEPLAAGNGAAAPTVTSEPLSEVGWEPGAATTDGDDGLFPPPGVDQGLTAAHEKHLNMLVGQLRKDGHLTTEHLWRACGLDPELGRGEDGELHWSPLRDRLTDVEGVALIERLSKLKASVEKKPFEIPEAARQ